MREALQRCDAGLPTNPLVRIGAKGGRLDHADAADAQPDPPNLTALKAELTATWPMTSLLDMVKEADLRLGFTDALKSPTAYETLDRASCNHACCSACMASAPTPACSAWPAWSRA